MIWPAGMPSARAFSVNSLTLLALPAISALLVINIAFGVMTRAAPQLNIFTIGFPLTLILGMIIFWISTADVLAHFERMTSETLLLMREMVRG